MIILLFFSLYYFILFYLINFNYFNIIKGLSIKTYLLLFIVLINNSIFFNNKCLNDRSINKLK